MLFLKSIRLPFVGVFQKERVMTLKKLGFYLVFLSVFLNSGCGRKTVYVHPKIGGSGVVSQKGGYNAVALDPSQQSLQGFDEARLFQQEVSTDRLFFAFDSHNLSEAGKSVLNDVVKFLNAHPGIRVLITGHCDKAGTVEYNLSLGGLRAEAVKKYLVSQGINDFRIDAVSKGKSEILGPNDRDNRAAVILATAPEGLAA